MANYARDLARIHHEGFGDYSTRAAPALLALLARAGIQDGLVVDLGCGGGSWLRLLDRAGYATFGVDASAPLVAIARRTAPRATLRVSSVYRAAIPRCVGITALGEVFNYLPAPAIGPFFRRVARKLEPGGLFVFDVLVRSSARQPPMETERFREGDGWAVLSRSREDVAKGRLTREITTFMRVGKGERYRRTHERHVLRVLVEKDVVKALESAGFSVRTARALGDLPMLPRRVAFIAELTAKRGAGGAASVRGRARGPTAR